MRLNLFLALLLTVAGCQDAQSSRAQTRDVVLQATQPSTTSATASDAFSAFKQKTEGLLVAVNEWKAKPDGEGGTFEAAFQSWTASLNDREKHYAASAKAAEAIDLFRRAKVAQRLSEENAGKADNSPLPESKAILALSNKYSEESELLAMEAEKLLLEVRRLLDAGEAANLRP